MSMGILLFFLACLPALIELPGQLIYEPPKILLLEIASFSSLALLLLYGWKSKRIWMWLTVLGWLDLAVISNLFILTLSTILSVDPAASFFGTTERGTGLLYYAALTALYFALRWHAQNRDWRNFALATCLVSGAISLYGILQWFGIDFAFLRQAFLLYGRSGPTRAFATLGHPNFLGGYLAMALPISLAVFEYGHKTARAMAVCATVLSLVALGLTYSRGAWLASAAGIFVFLVLRRKRTARLYAGLALIFCSVLAIAFAGVYLMRPYLDSTGNTFLYRIAAATDFSRGSTLARVVEWKFAAALMPARPILGYGLDTYENYSVLRNKDPLERNRDFDVPDPSVADRLHNVFLDAAWAAGLLGLFSFMALCCVGGVKLAKNFRANPQKRVWQAAAASVLVAYLIAGLTGFDFSLSGVLFYLALAYVAQERYAAV